MGRSIYPDGMSKCFRFWGKADEHTGTFFCDKTTAQSFPLTPTEVMFAAVMALNAYSISDRVSEM